MGHIEQGHHSITIDLPGRLDIRKILVIKWSALGDIAIASALFEDIFRAFPGREIHLNTLPPWHTLFTNDPRFSKVWAIDLRGTEQGLKGVFHWLREMRQQRYDLVIDLQSTDRARLMMSLLLLTGCKPPFRLGTQNRIPYNIAPKNLYPTGTAPRNFSPGKISPENIDSSAAPPPIHALDHLRASLRAGGIKTSTPGPCLYTGPEIQQRAKTLARQYDLEPGNYAVIIPGSQAAGHLKRWGARRYQALALKLHEYGLDKVVLIGGDDDMAECHQIADGCNPWLVNLCGRMKILELIPICANARCIIANDTGPAHIAAAAETPMLVICGPTDPRRVKPVGDHVVSLQADLDCVNCYRKTCSHHSCMAMITPEQVFTALLPFLEAPPSRLSIGNDCR